MILRTLFLSCIIIFSANLGAQTVNLSRLERALGADSVIISDATGKAQWKPASDLPAGNFGSGLDSNIAMWLNDTLTESLIYQGADSTLYFYYRGTNNPMVLIDGGGSVIRFDPDGSGAYDWDISMGVLGGTTTGDPQMQMTPSFFNFFGDTDTGIRRLSTNHMGLHGGDNTNPMMELIGDSNKIDIDPNDDNTIDMTLNDTMALFEKVRVSTHTVVTTQALAGFDSLNVMSRIIIGNGLTLTAGVSYDTLTAAGGGGDIGSGDDGWLPVWLNDTLNQSLTFESVPDSSLEFYYRGTDNAMVRIDGSTQTVDFDTNADANYDFQLSSSTFGGNETGQPMMDITNSIYTYSGDNDTGVKRNDINELTIHAGDLTNPMVIVDGVLDRLEFDPNDDTTIDVILNDTMLIAEKVRVGNHTVVTTQALAGFDSLNVMSRVILGNALSISAGASYDTLVVTEADGSTTNELQNLTIGGSGPTYTVDISSGTDVTIEAAGIAALSEPSSNVLRITATEVDGSITNEIQQITPGDNGTNFWWGLGSSTDSIVLVEGTGITMSRSGDNVTVSSSGITGSGSANVVPRFASATVLEDSQIRDNGTTVGVAVPAISLTGRFQVRGLGNAANALATFERLNGNNVFEFLENGALNFGYGSGKPAIYTSDAAGFSTPDPSKRVLMIAGSNNSSLASDGIIFTNLSGASHSSGTSTLMKVTHNFTPSSGSGLYTYFNMNPTINQTGGANGATRGYVSNPTLTSAASWASFESKNTTGIAFYETGGADSRFVGNVKVGADSAPLRDVDVTGTLRVTAEVDTAQIDKLWGGNDEGDMNRVVIGSGLSISNDTLTASASSSFGQISYNGSFEITNTSSDTLDPPFSWAEIEVGDIATDDATHSITTNYAGYAEFSFAATLYNEAGSNYTSYVNFDLYKNGSYLAPFGTYVQRLANGESKTIHLTGIFSCASGDDFHIRTYLSSAGTIDILIPVFNIKKL